MFGEQRSDRVSAASLEKRTRERNSDPNMRSRSFVFIFAQHRRSDSAFMCCGSPTHTDNCKQREPGSVNSGLCIIAHSADPGCGERANIAGADSNVMFREGDFAQLLKIRVAEGFFVCVCVCVCACVCVCVCVCAEHEA